MVQTSGIPAPGGSPLGSHDSGFNPLDASLLTSCATLQVTLETPRRASMPRHRMGGTAFLDVLKQV
jgi:hypothetical protein